MEEYFIKAQNGDKNALDILFNMHRGLVISEKKRIENIMNTYTEEDLEDLEQELNIALILAIKKFDVNKGYNFSTFGMAYIKNTGKNIVNRNRINKLKGNDLSRFREMKKLERKNKDITSEEVCKKLNIRQVDLSRILSVLSGVDSFSRVISNEDEENIVLEDTIGVEEDKYNKVESRIYIEKLLATLSKKERDIIELYFFKNIPQLEIAEKINTSQTTISRLINKSLKTMREIS